MSSSPITQSTLTHLTTSPTPFHNCSNLATLLKSNNYTKLSESKPWKNTLKKNGRYYFTRNASTIVAFCVGGAYVPGEGGCKIVGGHTDSPNLRLRPCTKLSSPNSITKLSIELYGGGLWHTWFDRDLGIAGRVLIRDVETGAITAKLININRALCRVPSLCIHLQTGTEREAFKIKKEEEMQAIFAQSVDDSIGSPASATDTAKTTPTPSAFIKNHEPKLLELIKTELNLTSTSEIADFELSLYDIQPASLGGLDSEFLHSARLDNQITCITSITGLIEYSSNEKNLKGDKDISIVCLFDHEEVGSASYSGAGSPILGEVVKRIPSSLNCKYTMGDSWVEVSENEDFFQCTTRKSFVISSDMAHAIHPNYPQKHQVNHSPLLNSGVVIKSNSNQRYTTNSFSGFIIRELSRVHNFATQEFVVRNDCPCGSTIGPIISEKTGIRCVDVGLAQWSMHSCRETMGVSDLSVGVSLFKGFFEGFRKIDERVYECE